MARGSGSAAWPRRGASGWALLVIGVVAWNVTAPEGELMSDAFRRGGPVVIGVWGLLTAHLLGVLPGRYDPLAHLPHWRRRR